MSLLRGLKNIMNVSDDDYEDDYEDEQEEPVKGQTQTKGSYAEDAFASSYEPSSYNTTSYSQSEPRDSYAASKRESVFSARREKSEGRNGDHRGKTVPFNGRDAMQLVLAKPERFDDVRGIADDFCSGKTVVLNLEKTDKPLSRRIIDFMSGVVYSRQGKLSKAANNTFVLAPADVDVSGEYLYEEYEEQNNLY